MNEFIDSQPYQEGVPHGPHLPYSETEALLRSIESQSGSVPSTPEIIQQEYQLFTHGDRIFWAWRQGNIDDLSHYWLKHNIKDAFKNLPSDVQ